MRCAFCNISKDEADRQGVAMVAGGVEPTKYICAQCAANMKKNINRSKAIGRVVAYADTLKW